MFRLSFNYAGCSYNENFELEDWLYNKADGLLADEEIVLHRVGYHIIKELREAGKLVEGHYPTEVILEDNEGNKVAQSHETYEPYINLVNKLLRRK